MLEDCAALCEPTNRASLTSRRACFSSRTPASRAPLSVNEAARLSVSTPAAARGEAYIGRPMEVSQSETVLTLHEGRGFRHISLFDAELVHGGRHVLARLLQVLRVTLHKRLRDATPAMLEEERWET
ncbi:hypothetical protein EYF80_024108 [Liparis tanakae]|uniref:Uncharacterized protein n=1 Tax=Liparis tanakae TaxID=230148 RepID=A0A4Z2HL80_9TELE|nr:hypothetical protein EYF80_024108 [Liparis tanakae]